MNARGIALGTAAACVALVLAQDVAPAWAGFHTWQYAATLAIGAIALFGYAFGARKGEDGERGRRLVVAVLGALVIVAAGIASGLLGPDARTVERAPGTVAPLPDVGAAAFFPVADASTIAAGEAHLLIRRRNASDIDVGPGDRRFVGASALTQVAAVVAYVEARDPQGRRLTITQPTNPAFLSPVLFFPQRVPIANKTLPADAFATPALHRQIKAFYFSKEASTVARAHGMADTNAVLFAVDDDRGGLVPGGIGFARSGQEILLGGVRLRPVIGTYPTLQVAAVPYPPALWLGGAFCVAGLFFAFLRADRPSTARVSALTPGEANGPDRPIPSTINY